MQTLSHEPTATSPTIRCGTWVILLIGWLAVVMLYSLLAPRGSNGGWVNCVLNNWRDHGYSRLQGRPILNPGGHQLPAEPEVYAGYRGYSLVPLHGLHLLTGHLGATYWLWTAGLTALLLLGAWWFLGRTAQASLVAVALCLSPGYLRACLDWDPIPTTLLLGLLLWMTVLPLLARSSVQPWHWLLVLGLLGLFALLEWSMAVALFIGWTGGAVLLWRHQRRRFWVLTVLLGLAVILGTVTLLQQKTGSSGGSLLQFALNYGFGTAYEGAHMSWPLALKRIGVANLIGLFPLWLLFGWQLLKALRHGQPAWGWALLPLAAATLPVLALRNPMAHHQWIPTAIFPLAIILALFQLSRHNPPEPRPPRFQLFCLPIVFLLYALGIGLLLRANAHPRHELVAFVQRHTPRSASVVLGPALQPNFPKPRDVGILLDRQVLPTPATAAELGTSAFLIDTAPVASLGQPVAVHQPQGRGWLDHGLQWYRRSIVKRQAHEQPHFGKTLYLYQLTPSVDTPADARP